MGSPAWRQPFFLIYYPFCILIMQREYIMGSTIFDLTPGAKYAFVTALICLSIILEKFSDPVSF